MAQTCEQIHIGTPDRLETRQLGPDSFFTIVCQCQWPTDATQFQWAIKKTVKFECHLQQVVMPLLTVTLEVIAAQ